MKKKFLIFLSILVLLLMPVYAHSGGTDENGGHYNHSTGEYHYHHGYSAHQHINGVCPYESKSYESKSSDTTEKQATSGSTSNWVQEHKVVDSKEDKEEDNNSRSNSIGLVAVSALAAGGIGYRLGKRKRQ